MKVWIVAEYDRITESDYIVAVFDTLDKAQRYIQGVEYKFPFSSQEEYYYIIHEREVL
jgi:hypothetical protein